MVVEHEGEQCLVAENMNPLSEFVVTYLRKCLMQCCVFSANMTEMQQYEMILYILSYRSNS